MCVARSAQELTGLVPCEFWVCEYEARHGCLIKQIVTSNGQTLIKIPSGLHQLLSIL